mgnify:CR=1 FL=1
MNTKTLISGLAGGIVFFLAGYLIYGVLLMDYFTSNMTSYPGLLKEPMELWAIGAGNLIWGILLAYIFNMAGISSASRGAVNGAIILFLVGLGVDLMLYGQWNIYSLPLSIIDALATGVLGALGGAVIGLLLGRSPVKTAQQTSF